LLVLELLDQFSRPRDRPLVAERPRELAVLEDLENRMWNTVDPRGPPDQTDSVAVVGVMGSVKCAQGLDGIAVVPVPAVDGNALRFAPRRWSGHQILFVARRQRPQRRSQLQALFENQVTVLAEVSGRAHFGPWRQRPRREPHLCFRVDGIYDPSCREHET